MLWWVCGWRGSHTSRKCRKYFVIDGTKSKANCTQEYHRGNRRGRFRYHGFRRVLPDDDEQLIHHFPPMTKIRYGIAIPNPFWFEWSFVLLSTRCYSAFVTLSPLVFANCSMIIFDYFHCVLLSYLLLKYIHFLSCF
mgnify:CR=1 FL=1